MCVLETPLYLNCGSHPSWGADRMSPISTVETNAARTPRAERRMGGEESPNEAATSISSSSSYLLLLLAKKIAPLATGRWFGRVVGFTAMANGGEEEEESPSNELSI